MVCKTNDSNRECGRCVVRILAALAGIVVAAGVSTGTLRAQTIPLEDVVPLTELETATDDLVRLATSYADAVREQQTAKLSADALRTLQPSSVVTNLEVHIANINLRTAEWKVRILRAIVEKQLAAARARLGILRRLEAVGREPAAREPAAQDGSTAHPVQSRILQAEATVQILQMILEIQ